MNASNDNRTFPTLLEQGTSSELSYLTLKAARTARKLELELLQDAFAGVDLRARLIGHLTSR